VTKAQSRTHTHTHKNKKLSGYRFCLSYAACGSFFFVLFGNFLYSSFSCGKPQKRRSESRGEEAAKGQSKSHTAKTQSKKKAAPATFTQCESNEKDEREKSEKTKAAVARQRLGLLATGNAMMHGETTT
jgi:hypothetical protein